MVLLDLKTDPLLGKAEYQELPLSAPPPPRTERGSRRTLVKCVVVLASLWAFRYLLACHGPKHFRNGHDDYSLFDAFYGFREGKGPLKGPEAEKLFLSVPSAERALAISREYATHPHLAGAVEDFEDAKVILELFQNEFGIPAPSEQPIFPAGTPESRNATLGITSLTAPSAWIDVYYPVMNTPLDRSVQILSAEGETEWDADLVEDGDPLDPEAAKYNDAVPTFHGLSRSGDVEGQLIYANYGTKADYDGLVASGANFTGKIVLTRYGAIFRGLKIKGAEELGAVGVLIYSDPRDDGSVLVENGYEAYPAGPARNPTAVQRGSVQYISIYSGDPTTPGYPAYENATRTEGTNIPKIPSLPISWANAARLLEELGGVDAGRKVTGNVSEKTVKLVNHVDTKVTPIWNTMVAIPGHIKNEVVLVGCHRDAWVMGAVDPVSGTVSLHEVVKGFGALMRNGWKPLRTIVFASWDAEEYGLIGSTEWGEDFEEWLPEHVVAYLNLDVSVGGSRWDASASPSLAHLIKRTAMDVPHPTIPGKTLWDAKTDVGPFAGPQDSDFMASYEAARAAEKKSDTGVDPLGSGSDFTVFLQRLGIASSDQGFGGTPTDAVYHYHSVYDSQMYQELYADPGFHRHIAVAKQLGLLTLRLTDAIILPLNTTQYALELDSYLDGVEEEAFAASLAPDFSGLRTSIKRLQSASLELDHEKLVAEEEFKKLLDELRKKKGVWSRIKEWFKRIFGHHLHPEHEMHFGHGRMMRRPPGHPHEHRSPLQGLSAPPFGRPPHPPHHGGPLSPPFGRPPRPDGPPHPPHAGPRPHGFPRPHGSPLEKFIEAAKRIQKVNKKLSSFEHGFISEDGIKDREWYKHLGVAPGKWLGYGATVLPGLTEAITIDKNVTLAQYEASRLTDLIDKLSTLLQV